MADNQQINNKADRDRVRQRSTKNRDIVMQVRRLLREYEQGRAASACMGDIKHLLRGTE